MLRPYAGDSHESPSVDILKRNNLNSPNIYPLGIKPTDIHLDFLKTDSSNISIHKFFKYIEAQRINIPITDTNITNISHDNNSNSPNWIINKFSKSHNKSENYRYFFEHFKIPEEAYEKLKSELEEKVKKYYDRFKSEKEKESSEKAESKGEDGLLKKIELYLKWNNLIQEAVERSPGYQLARLPDEERNRILEDEWLVKDPLTGICTGLAIDFLLHAETNPNFSAMNPSDNARYFEKLLIPAMSTVLKKNGLESPAELRRSRHYDEIYLEMKKVISSKAHLSADFVAKHHSMNNLSDAIADLRGHQLLFLEKKGREVAANHCIYFNPTTRIIADGGSGVVIQVPDTDSFSDFLVYYMERAYENEYELFSIASVKKDENAESIRFPSRWDKLQLDATLFSYRAQSYLMQETLSIGEAYKAGVQEIPSEFKTFALLTPNFKA